MKNAMAVVCLVACLALTASTYKLGEKEETFGVIVDEESQHIGDEAIQVGEVLCAISRGLRETPVNEQAADSETDEYFLKKLWKKAKNAVKQVGKGVEKAVKGVVTTKAADFVKKFLENKLGTYAFEDGKTYEDFRRDLAQDLQRSGEALIEKGGQLCLQCRGRRKLDQREKEFVSGVVGALS
ncbi:uncharacterized protein LOC144169460 [Haemaphysalis longicornis]